MHVIVILSIGSSVPGASRCNLRLELERMDAPFDEMKSFAIFKSSKAISFLLYSPLFYSLVFACFYHLHIADP